MGDNSMQPPDDGNCCVQYIGQNKMGKRKSKAEEPAPPKKPRKRKRTNLTTVPPTIRFSTGEACECPSIWSKKAGGDGVKP